MIIHEISYSKSRGLIEDFRAECYGNSLLQVSDVHDEDACHFIMKSHDGTVIGLARVLRSDQCTQFEIISDELLSLLPIKSGQIYSECSRLCVTKSGLNRRFVKLMHFLADYHIKESIETSVVCLDAAHAHLYLNLGFLDLGVQSRNEAFEEPGHIMLIDPKKLAQILSNKRAKLVKS